MTYNKVEIYAFLMNIHLLYILYRKLRPPKPRKVSDTQTHHGVQRQDPFSWMENLADPVSRLTIFFFFICI